MGHHALSRFSGNETTFKIKGNFLAITILFINIMNGNHKQFAVLVYRFNMFKLMEIRPLENPDKHDWFVRLKNFFLLFTNKSFYP